MLTLCQICHKMNIFAVIHCCCIGPNGIPISIRSPFCQNQVPIGSQFSIKTGPHFMWLQWWLFRAAEFDWICLRWQFKPWSALWTKRLARSQKQGRGSSNRIKLQLPGQKSAGMSGIAYSLDSRLEWKLSVVIDYQLTKCTRFTATHPICMETFKAHPQLGRFTLRDEGGQTSERDLN